jgi:PAS domain S-box-containing protein
MRPLGVIPPGCLDRDRRSAIVEDEAMSVHPVPEETRPSRADDQAFMKWLAPHLPPALKAINVPCYVLDRSGRIRWLNDAAKRMFGDVRGHMYTSVLDSSEVRRAHTRFASQIRGVQQPDVTAKLHSADGRNVRVEISSVPLRGNHHAIGVFGLAMRAPPQPKHVRIEHELTPRQLQVLHRLAEGASTEQIAGEFHLSRETVRNHVRHVLRRLGARSRLEAVAIAHRDGLL